MILHHSWQTFVFIMIIIVFGEGVVKAIKMTNEWKTLHIRRAFNVVYFLQI